MSKYRRAILESIVQKINYATGNSPVYQTAGRVHVGHYSLDYAAYYGGYYLVQTVNESGALHPVLGHFRCGAGEMRRVLLAFLAGVEHEKAYEELMELRWDTKVGNDEEQAAQYEIEKEYHGDEAR